MAISTTNVHKSVLRRFNGTDWIPVYLETSSDIVAIGKELKVLGGNPGAFKEGEIIPETESVQNIIQKLLQVRIAPKYLAPTIKLTVDSGNQPGDYEVGESITATVNSKFTKNSAGDVTSHTVSDGTTDVVTGTGEITNGVVSFTLGDTDVTLQSTCSYAQGPILQDNFEEDSPDGRIPAGAVSSDPIVYHAARSMFYGTDDTGVVTPLATSADIRSLDGTLRAPEAGSEVEISIPTGTTRVTVAYPATLQDLTRISYVESGGANVVNQFATTQVSVEGANGYAAVNYKVYTLAWVQPTAGPMTLKVTI